MVNDRQEFASKVQDNVAPDLAKMGLEVIAFTVQSFSDEGGSSITSGLKMLKPLRKMPWLPKAKAERERKEVEAEQDKLANDKRVAADLEVAQKQNELKLKQAALKQEADIAQAKADAAKGIEAEVQRREQERVAAEANIMKQEKEARKSKEREVKVREQELDATSANKLKLKNMRVNKLQKQNWSNANARPKLNSSKHKKPKLGKPQAEAEKFANARGRSYWSQRSCRLKLFAWNAKPKPRFGQRPKPWRKCKKQPLLKWSLTSCLKLRVLSLRTINQGW